MSDAQHEQAEVPLTSYMRQGSKKHHDTSHSILNARLLVVLTDRKLYGRALRLLYYVHEQLEELVNQEFAKGTPEFLSFRDVLCDPGLYRASRFAQDLSFYLKPGWRTDQITTEVQNYRDHLVALSAGEPILLLAHVYTQNIGISVGGHMVAKLARQYMQLDPDSDEGVAAFTFNPDKNPTALRVAFKNKLDDLGKRLSPELKEQMVFERQQAFQFNNAIMKSYQLDSLAFVRGLVNLMPSKVRTFLLFIGAACAAAFVYARLTSQKPSSS